MQNDSANQAELYLKMYGRAKDQKMFFNDDLQRTYDIAMPNLAKFNRVNQTPGQPLTNQRYDSTASDALPRFADNLIAQLMPPGLNWARLVAGANNDGLNSGQKATLQFYENTLFEKLNQSNFYRAIHSSLMEMAISTGVLLIKEGTKENPFSFVSVPLHTCYFGGSSGTGLITDVFRKLKVEGRMIKEVWPKAKLNGMLKRHIIDNPNHEFEFVEGTYFDPSKPKGKQYCYFVVELSEKALIIEENRSYSPWIVFREKHIAGELLGRGVLLDNLPLLRTLNKLSECMLRWRSYQCMPIFLNAGSDVNPYTSLVTPGSMISVNNPQDMSQLQVQGNSQTIDEALSSYRAQLLESMGMNQFTPAQAARSTATAAEILDKQRQAHNIGLAARLQYELNHQLVNKLFHILSRLGYWRNNSLEGSGLRIEFNAPVNQGQDTDDINTIVKYSQLMEQISGPQMAAQAVSLGLDITSVPTYVADKLGVDQKLIRSDLSKNTMLQQAKQMMSGQQQDQAALPQGPQPAEQSPLQGAIGNGQE